MRWQHVWWFLVAIRTKDKQENEVNSIHRIWGKTIFPKLQLGFEARSRKPVNYMYSVFIKRVSAFPQKDMQ